MKKRLNFMIAGATDRGAKRRDSPNQDQIGGIFPNLVNRRPPLLVLADGMGGYNGGALASRIVVQTFKRMYLNAHRGATPEQLLKEAVIRAHETIKRYARKDDSLGQMGSTVVAAILTEDKAFVLNVGDSRAYRINDREIIKLTEDDRLVDELVRKGLLTGEEALNSPFRNRLSMSLSAGREKIEFHLSTSSLKDDDVILLCSDGLWGVVDETIIRDIAYHFYPREACKRLIKLANSLGGPDNISVIIARRLPPPLIGRENEPDWS